MAIKAILKLIFEELNDFNRGYEEDIAPRSEIYIQEFSKNENSVKIIFDQVNFKILNISENVEAISGHTAESLRNKNITAFLKHIALEHIFFLYVWLKWVNQITINNGSPPHNPLCTFCGLKMKHKDGHTMRIMIRQTGLEFLEHGTLKVSVLSVDDVSHLIKSDFKSYWGRIEFGSDKRLLHHITSTDKKDIAHDILSDREKEVMRLIAKGMESKEIGKQLFASPHTVDNHRRNMIAKTGARDTTALVQLCRMTGII